MTGKSQHERIGMVAAWRMLADSVIDIRYVGMSLIFYNLLWFFSSLPIITFPPATAAMYVITRKIGYRESVDWRMFFTALITYFVVAWRWAVLNLAVLGIIGLNLWFYSSFSSLVGLVLTAFWVGLAFIWIMIQMYCFPVLLEQEYPHVLMAVRNAAALAFRHLFFTLTYALIAGFFVFMSVVVPYFWMIFTGALLAFFYNRGVYYLVQRELGHDPLADKSL